MSERKKKIAYIEHMVTDQGNGGAHCSNCGKDLTYISEQRTKEAFELLSRFFLKNKRKYTSKDSQTENSVDIYHCPGCGYKLNEGGISQSIGGTDSQH